MLRPKTTHSRAACRYTGQPTQSGRCCTGHTKEHKIINAPQRRSIRLRDYDYREAGAYFVTICTQDRSNVFGTIIDGAVRLNPIGDIVGTYWESLPSHFPSIELDAWVVMPNHLHGIVVLSEPNCTATLPLRRAVGTQSGSLGAIIQNFKSVTSRRIKAAARCAAETSADLRGVLAAGSVADYSHQRSTIWQRNYYEHIIRSEADLDRIREYIADNPARWETDGNNPNDIPPS